VNLNVRSSSAEEIGGVVATKSISWFCEILDPQSGIAEDSLLLGCETLSADKLMRLILTACNI
jgi:hypothetical protein